jgi:hypothetical protein
MGDCLLWAVFLKLRSSTHFVLLFPRKKLYINFDRNGFGYILSDFFSQTHLVTLLSGIVKKVNENQKIRQNFHFSSS